MEPSQYPPDSFESRQWVTYFTVPLCLTWATLMIVLRLWTRKVILNQLGVDDYAAIITWFIVVGDGIAIACSTKFGLGRHIWVVPPTDIPFYLRCFYVSIVLYTAALLSVKLTFLLQYYRVLAVQRMRKVYIAAIIIVGAWGISQVLIGIFMCRPIEGFWNQAVAATCIPNYPQFYINAAGNIITDVAVFLLPLPAISHLNLPRPQKLLLFGIFSIGFFTVAISVIRIKFLQTKEDFTWENVDASSWSIGELTSALTCACLLTLRPFVSRYFPALGTRASRSTKSYEKSQTSAAQDLESYASSRRMATHRHSESGDVLCDVKRDPNQRFPLEHQDSGDMSEGIMGLSSTREGLLQHARHAKEDGAERSRSVSAEQSTGLRPIIRTEAGPTRPEPARVPAQRAIQAQRAVYQTTSRR